ncbi:hypothetical protein BJ165DRAFT_1394660 [Panaeolus papilionaceus]|nr:hypothetical protein BJ165DRAFT_1394660 [Panaeolus papilionaceus]
MSSRSDHRRRDRSWERDDKDRDRGGHSRSGRGGGGDRYRDDRPKRSSRSRSPGRRDYREGNRDRQRGGGRGGGGDRRDRDRDYKPHRDDDRRDRDRDRREREDDRYPRDRDDRRDSHRRDDRDTPARDERKPRENESSDKPPPAAAGSSSRIESTTQGSASTPRPNLDPDAPDHAEDGEAMDETNDEEAAMMAMMGVSGFGTTKGKHVTGNQEGSVNIKKVRTWRQYMNRRGGFNRRVNYYLQVYLIFIPCDQQTFGQDQVKGRRVSS